MQKRPDKLTLRLLLLPILLAFPSLIRCQSTEKNEDRAELHAKLGISYYQNSNYPAALAELKKAEELNPKDPLIQNNIGLVYFMRERFDLAESAIRKAISINPKYTDAKNNLARVLIEVKKYPEAQKYMDEVLEDLTYGGLERAYVNQGLIHFRQAKYALAEASFKRAVSHQKDSCLANNFLGQSIFEQGDYERARAILDRAIGFCQKLLIDEPHYYSAISYYRSGDPDRAKARFEEIIKFYPNGRYLEKSRQMLSLFKKGEE